MEQATDRTKVQGAGRPSETSHMIHVLVEPAQFRTTALWQVYVEEPCNCVLVQVLGIQLALTHPPGKMGEAADVCPQGLGRIVALVEVTLEGVNVRRQRTLSKLINRFTEKPSRCVHRGLLK